MAESKVKFPFTEKLEPLRKIIHSDGIQGIQLANIFNACLADKPQHAEDYWKRLETLMKEFHLKPDNNDLKEEILFFIKYLFTDSFGCSVPPFIVFDFTLKNENRFDKLFAGIDDRLKIFKESHSGW
ncbi:MAG: hypothetical protein JXB88_00110 [Spirochaetales bacterium]|nr:hypothetical protein [Spirochaetales bacterium]